MITKRIVEKCVDECDRQQVGLAELGQLLIAYDWALTFQAELPSIMGVFYIASVVEPRNTKGYRRTPVTFANGKTAVHHANIRTVLERMWSYLDNTTDADSFVKAFLDVHPFEDGNGRTAFVLYNWLIGRLQMPVSLPDFYKE